MNEKWQAQSVDKKSEPFPWYFNNGKKLSPTLIKLKLDYLCKLT